MLSQSGWGAAAAAVGAEKARLSAEQTGGQSLCLLPCGEKKEQEKKGFPSRDPSSQKQILAGKSKSCPLTWASALLVWSRRRKTEPGKNVKIDIYIDTHTYLCVHIYKKVNMLTCTVNHTVIKSHSVKITLDFINARKIHSFLSITPLEVDLAYRLNSVYRTGLFFIQ